MELFDFGIDLNHAHVQPTGEYHYHGMPEKLIDKLNKGQTMTLVGWAADGFPMYARYGYSKANDANSSIKVLTSSYRLKLTPDAGRPAVSLYPLGTFRQDYEYVEGLGDLRVRLQEVANHHRHRGEFPDIPFGRSFAAVH